MQRPSSFLWRSPMPYIGIGVVVVLGALITAYVVQRTGASTQVQLGSGEYQLRVAHTERARVAGLAGVTQLSENGGLLMDFESDGQWGIWMKGMKIPIDIVWLNSNKQVVHIVENASPDTPETTYLPLEEARYVVELAAGAVSRDGITQGAVATFDLPERGGAQ